MSCPDCAALRVQIRDLERQLDGQAAQHQIVTLATAFRLNPQAAKILACLYAANKRVLSRGQLDEALPPTMGRDVRSWKHIDVLICRVRKSVGADAVETIPGLGFRITSAGVAACRAVLNPSQQVAA